MLPEEVKKRMAEMLLGEVRAGKMRWFYVSIANDEGFLGCVFLEARGVTEAHFLLHSLRLYPGDSGASTATYEIDEGVVMSKIPEPMRYRLLSRQQAEDLGVIKPEAKAHMNGGNGA